MTATAGPPDTLRLGPSASGRDRARGAAPERFEQPVHLVGSVVVDEPDPQQAPGSGEAKPLDQIGCVEVAVPGRDAVSSKGLGRSARRNALDRERQCRNASIEV